MSDYLLVGVVAAVGAALHRAFILWVYRSWFRQGFAGDAAFHLAVIREIKRNGRYQGIPAFLIRDEPDAYPILFHRIAALFPEAVIERRSYLPNAVVWVFATIAAALYAHYIGNDLVGLHGPQFALLFVLIFLLTASNIALDMNGLNYIALSERLLARFSCGAYFLSLATYLTYGDAVSLVVAIVAGTMALISSMFGRQVLFFLTPIVALVALSLWPFAFLGLCVVGALIVDREYFIRGLRQMANFSHAYQNHTKHSRYYKLGHSRFVDLRVLFAHGRGWSQRLYELEHNEPTRLAFRYPDLLLMLVLSLYSWQFTSPEFAIVVAACIVYIAISTEALRHFGEANRYIEFALWFIPSLFLARLILLGAAPSWVWIAYGGWTLLVTARKYRTWVGLSFPADDWLARFVAPLGLGAGTTIFTVPFTLGAAVHARTESQALMYQGSAVSLGLYEKFMEEIPFLKRNWQALAAEFNVTHIISERSYLGAMKSMVGWEYDFSALRKVAEDERYVAYVVTGQAA